MTKKVKYFLGIFAIILILVFAQRYFLFNSRKNSAYDYISRQMGLLTNPKGQKNFKKLNKKLTKLKKTLEKPSQDAGHEMVNGKHNRSSKTIIQFIPFFVFRILVKMT